ncbi:MAG TPA: hypothetical protein VN137_11950 [Sphingomonas sp.]|nr:hypothetical protein [Sphingomonas sp.]
MGGFIAEIFGGIILDGIVWGTGALILKVINPSARVDETRAVIVGLLAWLLIIGTVIAIGYWQFG